MCQSNSMQEYIRNIQEAKVQEYKKQKINRWCTRCAVHTAIEFTGINLREEMCLPNLLSFHRLRHQFPNKASRIWLAHYEGLEFGYHGLRAMKSGYPVKRLFSGVRVTP